MVTRSSNEVALLQVRYVHIGKLQACDRFFGAQIVQLYQLLCSNDGIICKTTKSKLIALATFRC